MRFTQYNIQLHHPKIDKTIILFCLTPTAPQKLDCTCKALQPVAKRFVTSAIHPLPASLPPSLPPSLSTALCGEATSVETTNLLLCLQQVNSISSCRLTQLMAD